MAPPALESVEHAQRWQTEAEAPPRRPGFQGEEQFVGAVSVAIGLLAIYAAASNRDWFYQLTKVRWLERRFSRTAARCLYAALGCAMLALGAAIACGFVLHR